MVLVLDLILVSDNKCSTKEILMGQGASFKDVLIDTLSYKAFGKSANARRAEQASEEATLIEQKNRGSAADHESRLTGLRALAQNSALRANIGQSDAVKEESATAVKKTKLDRNQLDADAMYDSLITRIKTLEAKVLEGKSQFAKDAWEAGGERRTAMIEAEEKLDKRHGTLLRKANAETEKLSGIGEVMKKFSNVFPPIAIWKIGTRLWDLGSVALGGPETKARVGQERIQRKSQPELAQQKLTQNLLQ